MHPTSCDSLALAEVLKVVGGGGSVAGAGVSECTALVVFGDGGGEVEASRELLPAQVCGVPLGAAGAAGGREWVSRGMFYRGERFALAAPEP